MFQAQLKALDLATGILGWEEQRLLAAIHPAYSSSCFHWGPLSMRAGGSPALALEVNRDGNFGRFRSQGRLANPAAILPPPEAEHILWPPWQLGVVLVG